MTIEGKRKLISFGVTMLVAIVNMFVADKTQAITIVGAIQEYLPTLAAMLLNGTYLGVQGSIDKKKIANGNGAVVAPKVEPKIVTTPMPAISEPIYRPPDWDELMAIAQDRAKKYTDSVPEAALFFGMCDAGTLVQADSLKQVVEYYDRLLTQGLAGWLETTKFPWSERHEEKNLTDPKKPTCPYPSIYTKARGEGYEQLLRFVEVAQANASYLESVYLKSPYLDIDKLFGTGATIPHSLFGVGANAQEISESGRR